MNKDKYGWIKCSDALPSSKDVSDPYATSDMMLIWCPRLEDGAIRAFYWPRDKVWCDDKSLCCLPDYYTPTHWQPLPHDPEDATS